MPFAIVLLGALAALVLWVWLLGQVLTRLRAGAARTALGAPDHRGPRGARGRGSQPDARRPQRAPPPAGRARGHRRRPRAPGDERLQRAAPPARAVPGRPGPRRAAGGDQRPPPRPRPARAHARGGPARVRRPAAAAEADSGGRRRGAELGALSDHRLRLPRSSRWRARCAPAGHAVRGTTRDPAAAPRLEAAGAEAFVGDPDRVGDPGRPRSRMSAWPACCWARRPGPPEQLRALHGTRLDMLLERMLDTTVRGVVYERSGTVDPAC